jgi:hypothetical protein
MPSRLADRNILTRLRGLLVIAADLIYVRSYYSKNRQESR